MGKHLGLRRAWGITGIVITAATLFPTIYHALKHRNAPDWLLPSKLPVKGHKKVSFCLLSGVVCLSAIKILQQLVLPELETASLLWIVRDPDIVRVAG